MKCYLVMLISLSTFFQPMLFAVEPPNYGAVNANNSCFMNAATQALFHIRPFRHFIKDNQSLYLKIDNQQTEATAKKFIDHLNNLAKSKQAKKAINPRLFRNTFPHQNINKESEIFRMTGDSQHDAQEFFSYILERFNTEIITNNKELAEERDKIFAKADQSIFKRIWNKIQNDSKPPEQYTNETLKAALKKNIDEITIENYRLELFEAIKDKNWSTISSILIDIIKTMNHLNEDPHKFEFAQEVEKKIGKPEIFAALLEFYQTIHFKKLNNAERTKKLKEGLDENDELKDESVKKFITEDELFTNYKKLADLGIIKTENKKIADQKKLVTLISLVTDLDLTDLVKAINTTLKSQQNFKKLFSTTLKKTLIHDGTNHTSEKQESNWILQLDVAQYQNEHIRLKDVISYYFQEEKNLEWRCSTCEQSISATKQLQIQRLPQILTMQFKRFLLGPSVNTKLNTPVIIDKYLYMNPPVSEQAAYYELFAMIMHGGGSNSAGRTFGHYWTYARWENNWFEYNDDLVEQRAPETIRDIIMQKEEKGNPYLVLYERSKNQIKAKNEYDKQEKSWIQFYKSLEERIKREAEAEKKRQAQLMPNLKKSLGSLKEKIASLETMFDTLTKKKPITTK